MIKITLALLCRRSFTCLGLVLVCNTGFGFSLKDFVQSRTQHYTQIYQDIHRNPELSGQEIETARKVAEHLRVMGIDVIENIGGFGVVGVLRNGQGPTGMLRADIDALPISEETGLTYSSQKPGVMHACGHDAHTALLLATAEVLSLTKDRWQGTMLFLFQPAEEIGLGAKAMIDAGIFDKLGKPDYGLAIHAHSNLPTGSLFVRAGNTLASSDSFDITLFGKGGHGAAPHLTIDPITLGASFVQEMNRLVAREIDPMQPAVITVGSFHSGSKHNIISDKAILQLTVRTYEDSIRNYIKERINAIARGLAQTYNAPEPVVNHTMGIPSTYNDPGLYERVTKVLRGIFGSSVLETPQVTYSEDFSYYFKSAGIPTFFYWVGAQNSSMPKPWPQAHTSKYAPDFQGFFETGIVAMTAAVVDLQSGLTIPNPK